MTSKVQLFNDMNTHLLEDEIPSSYFNHISNDILFKEYPFDMLTKQKETMQSPIHHPEGSVWNHTMLVIDSAALVKNKAKNVKAFMWAALLHDIGKPNTTRNKKGKITSYDHDKVGAEMAREFLSKFTKDNDFIQYVVSLVRWHMHILYVLKNLPFGDVKAMKEQANIEEVALLGLCDRLGRLGADREKEEKNISEFLCKCKML